MKYKQLIYGLLTNIPGIYKLYSKLKGTGGTNSARYCYSVWLRHMVMAKKNGLNYHPKVVAELGPGDSLGVGLSALICGCEKYLALDVFEYTDKEKNLKMLDELLWLFKVKQPIPGDDEFPEIRPCLENYDYPNDILDEIDLNSSLYKSRIEEIRNSINNLHRQDSLIQYVVPCHGVDTIKSESIDMIFSQAVLEHIDDLVGAYRSMYYWLKPSGYISNMIDFRSHGLDDEWNGHWKYSDFIWKQIRGKRPYLINREPHSKHIKIMLQTEFEIVCDIKYKLESRLKKDGLASRFQTISDEDIMTSGSFIQAIKKIEGKV